MRSVLASLVLVSVSATAARAGRVPTGNDVSYPQCGQALPAGQAFGIVAVNEGLANTTNPCLDTEITWAQASAGKTSQPPALAVREHGQPGPPRGHRLAGDQQPAGRQPGPRPVRHLHGTCTGANNPACAWQ